MLTRVTIVSTPPRWATISGCSQLCYSRGFTLVEMFIALVALSILLSMSLPSFRDTVEDVNTNARVKELLTSLNLARSEAVKRGEDIHICAANNAGTDCAAGQWSLGWIVFEDVNGDADGSAGSIDAGDDVIRVVGTGRSPSVITFTAALVTFDNMGFNAASAPQEFEILPESSSVYHARCVQLSAVGRPLSFEGECP